jgi:hypothetical protein
LRALDNNLEARVVEDDHPILLGDELLEEDEIADLQVVGDDKICLAGDGLATHSLMFVSHWKLVVVLTIIFPSTGPR